MSERRRRHASRAILGSLFVLAILVNLSAPGRSDHLNATNATDIDCIRSNGTVAKTGSSPGPVFPGDPFSYQIDLELGSTFEGNAVTNIERGILDSLPADFLLDSLVANEVAGSAITCSVPPPGTSGLVSCSLDTPLDQFEGSIDLFGHIADEALPGLLTNTASAYINASTSIGRVLCLANATWEVQIVSPANVTADKTVSGSFVVGGAITYQVVLFNSGPAAQVDAPGNEFTDVLPAELDLDCDAVTIVSGGGIVGCDDGANTVVWSGPIPAGESVTLSIGATIVGGTPGSDDPEPGELRVRRRRRRHERHQRHHRRPRHAARSRSDGSGARHRRSGRDPDRGRDRAPDARALARGRRAAPTARLTRKGPLSRRESRLGSSPSGTSPSVACGQRIAAAKLFAPCQPADAQVLEPSSMSERRRRDVSRAVLGALFLVALVVSWTSPGLSDHLGGNETIPVSCELANGTPVGPIALLAKDGSSSGPLLPGASFSYQLTLEADNFNGTHQLSDPLPGVFLLDSLVENENFGSPISCSGPPAGTSGNVTCTLDAPGSGFFGSVDLFGSIADDAPPGLFTNTATFEFAGNITGQQVTCSGSSSWEATIISPANVTADKTVSGSFVVGGAITYQVVLFNSGPAAQVDAPGNEFTDVLPPELDLDCNTTDFVGGGTLGCDDGSNTVFWNGPIPAGGSVTITIGATIVGGTPGSTILNQGGFVFDADGDGTSESNGTTDDPGTPPDLDPTALVLGTIEVDEIPTAGGIGLLALALLLAVAALPRLRD